MQDQSAQLKPGLPQIGQDPISKALAWLRTQGGKVESAIGGIANNVVNDSAHSALGKIAQGKFNEVLPTLNKTVQDYSPNDLMKTGKLSQKDMENMSKVSFVGDMIEIPSAPKIIAKPGLPDIPQGPTQILDKYGNPMKNANAAADVGSNPPMGHYILDENKNLIPNESPANPVYSQESPAYPNATTPQERANFNQTPLTEEKTLPNIPQKPQQKPLNLWQKILQRVNGIDNYQLPSSYSDRIGKEAIDKSVMQNDIGGNTFDQVLSKITPAKQKIWNQALTIAKSDPNPINFDAQVKPFLEKEMQKLISDGVITADRAAQELTEYSIRLKDAANQGLYNIDSTQVTAPLDFNQPISMDQLFHAKTAANGMAGSAYDAAGGVKNSLNTTQRINLALADGMDNAVTSINPALKEATQKYSAMSRIESNISNAMRNQSLNVNTGLPIINKIPFTGIGRRIIAAVMSGNPTALTTLGLVGGAIGKAALDAGVPKYVEDFVASLAGYQPKEPQNGINGNSNNIQNNEAQNGESYSHGTTIAPDLGNIKPDNAGNYTIADPALIKGADGSSLSMSQEQYKNESQLLTNLSKNYAYMQNPQNAAEVNGDIKNLERKWELSQDYQNKWTQATNLNNRFIEARQSLKDAPTNLFSAYPTLDALRQATDPKYRKLASDLEYLATQYPAAATQFIDAKGNIKPQNPQSLYTALDTVNNQMVGEWNAYLQG